MKLKQKHGDIAAIILLIIAAIMLYCPKIYSQESFTSVSFQVDLGGSIDKQGLNSLVSLSVVDFGWLEYEVQIQSIINDDNPLKDVSFTYLDMQLGVGVMLPISNNIYITPGIHWGLIVRPNSIVYDANDKGLAGMITYGPTLKGRLKLTNKLTLVISSSFDRRPDVSQWGVINGRGGLELIIN